MPTILSYDDVQCLERLIIQELAPHLAAVSPQDRIRVYDYLLALLDFRYSSEMNKRMMDAGLHARLRKDLNSELEAALHTHVYNVARAITDLTPRNDSIYLRTVMQNHGQEKPEIKQTIIDILSFMQHLVMRERLKMVFEVAGGISNDIEACTEKVTDFLKAEERNLLTLQEREQELATLLKRPVKVINTKVDPNHPDIQLQITNIRYRVALSKIATRKQSVVVVPSQAAAAQDSRPDEKAAVPRKLPPLAAAAANFSAIMSSPAKAPGAHVAASPPGGPSITLGSTNPGIL